MFFNLGFPSQGSIRDTVANLGAGSKNLDPHNTMYRYTLPGTDLGFTFEKWISKKNTLKKLVKNSVWILFETQE